MFTHREHPPYRRFGCSLTRSALAGPERGSLPRATRLAVGLVLNDFERTELTRNQAAVIQSLVVIGIMLLILAAATFSLSYHATATAFAATGVVAMIGALIARSTIKPPK